MKNFSESNEIVLDTSGTECPVPVLKARKLAAELKKDAVIRIIATDPLAEPDFEYYCNQCNFEYLGCYKDVNKIIIRYKFKVHT
tara:strand:- start:14 stop:265 length:252 start_codon:yes stop_codon:yes gene_type:complete